ncbi:MAG: hypothetical protein INF48_11585 [Rhodobacter sp.]|nr:hypothetical protein [Rhodobacter sp.]
MQIALCLGLHGVRQRVQHVHRRVGPASLFARCGEDPAQRRPEPKGTVAEGRLRVLFQAAPLEIGEQAAPALRAFAKTVGYRRQFLAALFIGTGDQWNALFFRSHSRPEANAIRPDAEEPPLAKVAPQPCVTVRPPAGLWRRDGPGRQPPGIRSRQGHRVPR